MPGWLNVTTGLSPLVAAALALAVLGVVTALHLLRTQRRRLLVSWEPLWRAGAGTAAGQRRSGRLRRWGSWALQLAIGWLLVLGAAGVIAARARAAPRALVVLVDLSASMAAGTAGGSRLDEARAQAGALLAGLGPRDLALVAGYGRRVHPESHLHGDRTALAQALQRLRPREEGGDVAAALTWAQARLRGQSLPAQIWIYTDDAAAAAAASRSPAPPAPVETRVVPVGRPLDNTALVALALQRRADDATMVDAHVTVQSWAAGERPVMIELRDGPGGRVLAQQRTLVPAGARRELQVSFLAVGERPVEAALVTAGGDALALDDHAYGVVPPPGRRRVLVVGERDLYLEAALLGLGAGVSVERLSPSLAAGRRATFAGYDAVVFDGVTPAEPATEGRFLYLDPAGPGSPFAESGRVRDPIPTTVRRQHPLLAHVSLADLNVAQARRLAVAPGDEVVVAALETPLLIARQRPGLRLVALSFDPRRSDLPLRPAFPLLLGNVLDWLSRGRGAGAAARTSWATGTVARLPVAVAAERAVIVDPAGDRGARPVVGGWLEVPLPSSGIYRIAPQPAPGPVVIAASFVDPAESDTRRAAAPPPAPAPAPVGAPAASRALDVGAAALLLAFALGLLEWLGHQRRWIF